MTLADPADPIPLTRPSTDGAELAAVARVLESGWLAGQGPQGTLLEDEFAKVSGRAHAIAVNNCTAGLHLAVQALGLEPGDEVLVADYTFPATAHAVIYAGGVPRFVDVRPDTATMDLDSLRARISPRTRGIIGVDALGMPADWQELEGVAAEHGVWLLGDAACSAGGTYHEQPCGSFGDVAVFSLHARKGITSGEGGVIVTDDAELAARMRSASCFGMRSALERQEASALEIPRFPEIGYNYKLSDILAAVARAQVGKLEDFLAARRHVAMRYTQLFRDMPHLVTPSVPIDRSPTWQTYAITLDPTIDRDQVIIEMRRRGIGTNIGTYALNQQSVYADSRRDCPISDSLFAQHLALPMYADLTESGQERVVRELVQVIASL